MRKHSARGESAMRICTREALDIDGTNSHDALDDALACAGLFFKLLEGTN